MSIALIAFCSIQGSYDFLQTATAAGIWATLGPNWLHSQVTIPVVLIDFSFCDSLQLSNVSATLDVAQQLKQQGAKVMVLFAHQDSVYQFLTVGRHCFAC